MAIKKKKSNRSYGQTPIKGVLISLRGLLPKAGIKYKREVYKGNGDTFKSTSGTRTHNLSVRDRSVLLGAIVVRFQYFQ